MSESICKLQLTEPTVGEKRCSECGEHKPANQFYKNRTNKDGLFGKCKLCSEGTKKERALNDVTVDRKVIVACLHLASLYLGVINRVVVLGVYVAQ